MEPTKLAGRHFGLVADTHDSLIDWPAALSRLQAAFGDVDAILHCGDISSVAALETLAQIAPVYATRSDGDPPASPPVLVEGPRLFRIGDLNVGLVFSLGARLVTPDTAQLLFGSPIDVCIFGGTHASQIASAGGVLYINPGSPTLAEKTSVAFLTIDVGVASAEIVEIPT